MKYRLTVTIALLISGSPALAREMDYGWCEARGSDGNYLMSGLLQVPEEQSNEKTRQEFRAFVGGNNDVECWMYYSSESDGEYHFSKRRNVIETQEHKRFTLTGWTGPYRIAGEASSKPRDDGFAITIAGAEEEAARQKALAEAHLENMRAHERRQVEALAASSKYDEENRAAIERLKEHLRKRGMAQ